MKRVLAIATAVSTGAATFLFGLATAATTIAQTNAASSLAPMFVLLTAASLAMCVVSTAIAVRSKPIQT